MSRFQDVNFVDDISRLYLNEQYSDIVFHIGDTQLPGHQVILAQRAPGFSTLFLKEDNKTRKQAVTLTETTVEAFKQFLKFIYTGAIDFEELEIAVILGILQLAVTCKMKLLKEATVGHLMSICNDDNLCDVLNVAVKCSQIDLVAHCLEQVKTNNFNILISENFKLLSVKALSRVLNFLSSKVPDLALFFACVEWMKANPDEAKNFPDLLNQVYLKSITLDTLANAIQQCQFIDVATVFNIVNQQEEKPRYPLENVITPGVRVITGGNPTFSTIPVIGSTLKHNAGNNNEYIVIDLRFLYMLNCLEMQLAGGDNSYWIEVSKDNVNWARIVDYDVFVCRSVQRLLFRERPVRYIRIRGTDTVNNIFEISRLEAYYITRPFPETRSVQFVHNVVLKKINAVVIQGENSCDTNGMPNGCVSDDSHSNHDICEEPVTQLPQPS